MMMMMMMYDRDVDDIRRLYVIHFIQVSIYCDAKKDSFINLDVYN